jgi:putative tricarboxylic transport membrane protein
MRADDRRSSLFWLFFAILFFAGSLRLGVGTSRAPGMGFISFGTSVLLGILSIALFLKSIIKKEAAQQIPDMMSKTLWRRVLLILISLFMYAALLPVTGYLVTTFVFMSFLFWIIRRPKLRWALALSFVTTLVTYYVFVKWLNCQFPTDFFGL